MLSGSIATRTFSGSVPSHFFLVAEDQVVIEDQLVLAEQIVVRQFDLGASLARRCAVLAADQRLPPRRAGERQRPQILAVDRDIEPRRRAGRATSPTDSDSAGSAMPPWRGQKNRSGATRNARGQRARRQADALQRVGVHDLAELDRHGPCGASAARRSARRSGCATPSKRRAAPPISAAARRRAPPRRASVRASSRPITSSSWPKRSDGLRTTAPMGRRWSGVARRSRLPGVRNTIALPRGHAADSRLEGEPAIAGQAAEPRCDAGRGLQFAIGRRAREDERQVQRHDCRRDRRTAPAVARGPAPSGRRWMRQVERTSACC